MTALRKFTCLATAVTVVLTALTACSGGQEIPVAPTPATPIATIQNSLNLTEVHEVEITGYRKVPGRELNLELTAGDPNCYAVALSEMQESPETVSVRVEVGKLAKPIGDCTEGDRTVLFKTMMKVNLGDRKVLRL